MRSASWDYLRRSSSDIKAPKSFGLGTVIGVHFATMLTHTWSSQRSSGTVVLQSDPLGSPLSCLALDLGHHIQHIPSDHALRSRETDSASCGHPSGPSRGLPPIESHRQFGGLVCEDGVQDTCFHWIDGDIARRRSCFYAFVGTSLSSRPGCAGDFGSSTSSRLCERHS